MAICSQNRSVCTMISQNLRDFGMTLDALERCYQLASESKGDARIDFVSKAITFYSVFSDHISRDPKGSSHYGPLLDLLRDRLAETTNLLNEERLAA